MKPVIWLANQFPDFKIFSIVIITLSIVHYFSGGGMQSNQLGVVHVQCVHHLRSFVHIQSLERKYVVMPGCGTWQVFLGVKNSSWTSVLLISHWWKYVEVLKETRSIFFFCGISIWSSYIVYSHIVPWLSINYMQHYNIEV